jgi:hypothetical protein
MRYAASRIAFALSLLVGVSAAAEPGLKVVGTEFQVTTTDGRVLTGEALVGAVLTMRDRNGGRQSIRIDAVERDPQDAEIILYAFSVPVPGSDDWENPCRPGPDGLALGLPLSGSWDETGEYHASSRPFSLTCTAGAVGKCVRAGYKPWKMAEDGTPLAPYLQACTRMIRADYCGDGIPRTRDGTAINVYDRLGIQERDDASVMRFEAAWGPDGAVAVARTRLPEIASVADVLSACPDRLAGKTGPKWTEAVAAELPEALIFNDSRVPGSD